MPSGETAIAGAATEQFRAILGAYGRILPRWSFPYVPLAIAAAFQVFAWFGGRFLHPYSLVPRVLLLWLFALGEYTFMSPAMNASVELLGMEEAYLVVAYLVITLLVFMFINAVVFRNGFKLKYLLSYLFLSLAVYFAHMP